MSEKALPQKGKVALSETISKLVAQIKCKKMSAEDEIDAIMNCINFAKALSDILKAPLFDSNGKLSKQIDETLRTGNEYVRKIQTAN